MDAELRENPREHCDWRHHKTGCPNYRERWFPGREPGEALPMYQVFCFLDTPPVTFEEQERCLASRNGCWRLAAAQAAGAARTAGGKRAKRPA
ncbi:MAG TPA: hypothetical protein VID73_11865 [Ktedonobacterales bacterium]